MRIYGLNPTAASDVGDGKWGARIDGLDPSARIGFELSGLGCMETWCNPADEPPSLALDVEEARELARQGFRLHVAEVARYRSAGDRFTPTLAYLAGLVRFLNRVTDGEDVVLDGLLFAREREGRLPIELLSSDAVTRTGRLEELAVRESTTFEVVLTGLDFGARRSGRELFESEEDRLARVAQAQSMSTTHGAPSVLLLDGYSSGLSPQDVAPTPRLRVSQVSSGVERVMESHSWALFLGSDFDLMRPFDLELELAPGRYSISTLRLGGVER